MRFFLRQASMNSCLRMGFSRTSMGNLSQIYGEWPDIPILYLLEDVIIELRLIGVRTVNRGEGKPEVVNA